jgi:hypothetical protein
MANHHGCDSIFIEITSLHDLPQASDATEGESTELIRINTPMRSLIKYTTVN